MRVKTKKELTGILLTQNGVSLVECYVSGVIAFKLIRIEGVAGCGCMQLTGELEWQPI